MRGGNEREGVDVGKKSLRDDLFQQFATAFKQADGTVGLGGAVVWFVGFRDDHYLGRFPGVVSQPQCPVEEFDEPFWAGCKGPLQELVPDAARARRRAVLGAGKAGVDLIRRDWIERARGAGRGVISLYNLDLVSFRFEETAAEGLGHFRVVTRDMIVAEERGYGG